MADDSQPDALPLEELPSDENHDAQPLIGMDASHLSESLLDHLRPLAAPAPGLSEYVVVPRGLLEQLMRERAGAITPHRWREETWCECLRNYGELLLE